MIKVYISDAINLEGVKDVIYVSNSPFRRAHETHTKRDEKKFALTQLGAIPSILMNITESIERTCLISTRLELICVNTLALILTLTFTQLFALALTKVLTPSHEGWHKGRLGDYSSQLEGEKFFLKILAFIVPYNHILTSSSEELAPRRKIPSATDPCPDHKSLASMT